VLKATTLYCLVMEYAKGGELLTFIKNQKDGRLDEAVARPFVRQLVSALHYIHERGIVHRSDSSCSTLELLGGSRSQIACCRLPQIQKQKIIQSLL